MHQQHFSVDSVSVDDLSKGSITWQEEGMEPVPGTTSINDQSNVRYSIQNVT